MGMFDDVTCDDDRVVCCNGHKLTQLQTKDFDNVCGTVDIRRGRIVGLHRGLLNVAPTTFPVNAVADVYEECDQCPVLLTNQQTRDGTEFHSIVGNWCEFTLTIVDSVIVDVKRISPSFIEWLASVPDHAYLRGCDGPMSMAEASAKLHAFNVAAGWRV